MINMILVLEYMRFSNSKLKMQDSRLRGLSLVEVIIYIAALGGVAVFIGNFLLHTVGVYQRARAEREVIANGRLLMETITRTVSQASEIYTPTSRLNIDAGQISVITPATSTPGHTTAYIDFWLDNGLLYTRQEGQGSIALSSSGVRVTKFNLERIVQDLDREAVRIILQVDSASKFPASTNLITTASLRGSY